MENFVLNNIIANNSDNWSKGMSRSPLIFKNTNELTIHIFIDKSSIEIYTDEYKTIHSCNVYANEYQNKNFISVDSGELFITEISSWNIKRVVY